MSRSGSVLAWLSAFSCAALLASPSVAPAFTPWLLVLCGVFLVACVAERSLEDRWLVWIAIGAYVAKASAIIVLFYASLWHVPLFRSLQVEGGFWTLAPDAVMYHNFGTQVADAWRWGLAFPSGWETVEGPSLYVGAIYYFLGAHPLNALILNAWYGSFTVVLAVLLIRQFNREVVALRVAACLIAFWPSLTLWSTQLLKDPIATFLLTASLYLLAAALTSAPPPRRAWWRWMALGVVPFPLWFFRYYLGVAVCVALVAVAVPWIAAAASRRQYLRAGRVAAVLAVTLLSTMAAKGINFVELTRPADPARGYLKLGSLYAARGDHEQAARMVREALKHDPSIASAPTGVQPIPPGGSPPGWRGPAAHEAMLASTRVDPDDASVPRGPAPLRQVVTGEETYDDAGLLDLQATAARGGRMAAFHVTRNVAAIETELLALPELPAKLGTIRTGIANEGGASVVDGHVRISNARDAIEYLPRGLFVLLFAPVPFFDLMDAATGTLHNFHGRNSSISRFAVLETVALYCLYPALLVVARSILSQRDPRLWLILAATVLPASAMAVAIPNIGTLFRLRGQFIVPLIILIAATGAFSAYGRLWDFARRGHLQAQAPPRSHDRGTVSRR